MRGGRLLLALARGHFPKLNLREHLVPDIPDLGVRHVDRQSLEVQISLLLLLTMALRTIHSQKRSDRLLKKLLVRLVHGPAIASRK
jgi:hypothetical protein